MDFGLLLILGAIAGGLISLVGSVVPFLVPPLSLLAFFGLMMLYWWAEQAEREHYQKLEEEKEKKQRLKARRFNEPEVF